MTKLEGSGKLLISYDGRVYRIEMLKEDGVSIVIEKVMFLNVKTKCTNKKLENNLSPGSLGPRDVVAREALRAQKRLKSVDCSF